MSMTRKEYLEKCQKMSVVPTGTYRNPLEENIPSDCIFEINGIKYYPVGYILTYENGKSKHTAELREVKTHYEHLVDLSDILGKGWK